MNDTERLEQIQQAFALIDSSKVIDETNARARRLVCDAATARFLLTRLEEAELRNLQYDNIVRGVCNDLGIDEGAGCDEIAMASANARSLRDRIIEVVEQMQSTADSTWEYGGSHHDAMVKTNEQRNAVLGEVATALKEIDIGHAEEEKR